MEFKNAFITGASSGIGRGLARWFAARGVRVYAAARRAELLSELEREAPAGQIVPVVLDVARTDEVVRTVERLDVESGGLDLVVANAGVGEETNGRRLEWTKVERVLQVNVMGAAATLSAALPKMVERNRGHLVGISSVAATRGLPGWAAYCSSKAFLNVFLESLRVDLKRTQVRVTCVQPGYVRSEMTANNKHSMPFILDTDDAVERIAEAVLRADASFIFPLPMAFAAAALKQLPNAAFDALSKRLR